MKLIERIQSIRTAELLIIYVALFGLYVIIPFEIIHSLISPAMLILMAVVFINALGYLKQS
ncbi:MAG TPA: hypothetical protein VLE72_03995 [Candidatus Saccharimonadales bacterium]|nr:hypothetical protein [Candidatus Saccharimonadales bacterium]